MRLLAVWPCVSALLLSSVLAPGAARADSLTDAFRLAYETNPGLVQARAGLRAVDEGVAQARAAMRPSVGLSGTIALSQDLINNTALTDTYTIALNASLTLYDGGRSALALDSAREAVMAARANLLNVEQGVMLDTVAAYMNVRRDLQGITLARNNVRVLEQQVQATQDRFEVGSVTRTDLALAEARVALARSALAAAQGRLAASRESYRVVVGVAPTNLSAPPGLPRLPASLAEAEDTAMRSHPLILAALHNERAAQYDLQRASAARGVSVNAQAGLNYTYLPDMPPGFQDSSDLRASVTASVPLYSGGALSSVVRQAGTVLERRAAETQEMRRIVRQNVALAHANVQVADALIAANRLAVQASELALRGTEEEVRLGARTTLDLLDAEQALLDARTNLIGAERDRHVAAYNLLAAMGLLTAERLQLGIELYDPEVNFNRVQSAPRSTFGAGRVVDAIADRWQ